MAFLGILPVYYKTFAFMRSEPWVLFLGLVSVYEFLAFIQISPPSARSYWQAARIGLWLGLAMIARQWAIFIIIAIALFILREIWKHITKGQKTPTSSSKAK